MPSGVNPGDDGVGTSVAGAATVNHTGGTITTEALVTAATADYSFTLTNNVISPGSIVLLSVGNGTNTTVPYYVHSVQVGNGSVTFKIRNAGAGALNGTLIIYFACL
jgi:hypothetical protein